MAPVYALVWHNVVTPLLETDWTLALDLAQELLGSVCLQLELGQQTLGQGGNGASEKEASGAGKLSLHLLLSEGIRCLSSRAFNAAVACRVAGPEEDHFPAFP